EESQPAMQGLNENRAIVLDGVSSCDFDQFLKLLYSQPIPLDIDTNTARTKLGLSVHEWMAALKISHHLWMMKIHQLSIDCMTDVAMDPVDKAAMALEYGIESWLKPSLNELARRPQPMTRADADRLGIDVILKMAEVRESI
ncbi:hypothetical protein CONPUDRAFT_31265, partial [Coniophora puteana RWD-64-598 SS2]